MIIWLYGEDTYRSRQKLREFKDKFIQDIDASGNSLVELDGESLDMVSFSEAVAAPSLFARKRMVIIERLFQAKKKDLNKQIADFIGKQKEKADNNIIVFWDEISSSDKKASWKSDALFKLLEKQQIKQEFKAMSATEAQEWSRIKAQELGARLRIDAARVLVALAGTDLWTLNNEITKLVNYKQGQKLLDTGKEVLIEVTDVEQMVKGAVDENIFAFTDALSRKDKAEAMARLESELEAGAADTYLMHMIIRQFRIMMQIKQALDLGQSSRKMQSELKLHPFVIQKTMGQVRYFSLAMLKEIFVKLTRIDHRLKTGKSDLRTDLSLLISVL